MRKIPIYLSCLVLFVALAFWFGPRPEPVRPVELHAVNLPPDLDSFLAEREAKVPNLRAPLAAHIQWEEPAHPTRTKLALVYLHSYTGSPLEIDPVIVNLGHRLHANVFFPRFRGHGQDSDAMAEAKVSDWLEEANEALAIGQRLGEKVALIGFSTGGTLATWLAIQNAPAVALVLLAPNYGPKDWRANLLLMPWGDRLAQASNHGSRYREWVPENELQRARWTYKQPVESLITMMQLVQYVNAMDFRNLKLPTLCLYTDVDRTVSVPLIKKKFALFGSANKELVDVPDARWHVLTGDAFSPNTTDKVTDRIETFLRPFAESK